MTTEFERFCHDLTTDTALRARVAAAGDEVGALLAVATESGYAVTRDELARAVAAQELSQAQLDQIHGGVGGWLIGSGGNGGGGVTSGSTGGAGGQGGFLLGSGGAGGNG